MKVSSIKLNNFKRFTNLTIKDIPQSAKLVIIVGPNGSGKSSLFDAFNQYYKLNSGFGSNNDEKYYRKSATENFDWNQTVKISFHDHQTGKRIDKKSMYFRTAYRNDPDFNVSNFTRVGAPHDTLSVQRLIDNDQSVSQNYQRLIHRTMAGVFSESNDSKSVKDLREELIGKIRDSMLNVFDDLVLNNIGDPLRDGAFYFKKGAINSYHYKNLSGGEKAAFDLLLDLIIKIEYYDNSMFFIDEPESHMHTSLQGRLIKEMFRVVPEKCQMWITTHSLGVMRKAKELSRTCPGKVVFIDFGEIDFDNETTIIPASIDGLMWEKFLSVAIGDYANNLGPDFLIMCEGDINGKGRKNFDSFVYGKIFKRKYHKLAFVSGGSCTELVKSDHMGFKLLSEVLTGSRIARLIDRDDKSETEVQELEKDRIYVTSRRHIESYLFDDQLIEKLVLTNYQKDLIEDDHDNPKTDEAKQVELVQKALKIKTDALSNSIARGNPPDDIKSASCDIYLGLKQLLKLTRCGNNADMFMRDVMSELITEDTIAFKEMDVQIIQRIKNA